MNRAGPSWPCRLPGESLSAGWDNFSGWQVGRWILHVLVHAHCADRCPVGGGWRPSRHPLKLTCMKVFACVVMHSTMVGLSVSAHAVERPDEDYLKSCPEAAKTTTWTAKAEKACTAEIVAAIEKDLEKMRADARRMQQEAEPARGARIGMTAKQVIEKTLWGRPSEVSHTITARGVYEQWIYMHGDYMGGRLYFLNGRLTAIEN